MKAEREGADERKHKAAHERLREQAHETEAEQVGEMVPSKEAIEAACVHFGQFKNIAERALKAAYSIDFAAHQAALSELQRLYNELKAISIARRLLTRALDAIPGYTDGRNDRLCDAIDKWLEESQGD